MKNSLVTIVLLSGCVMFLARSAKGQGLAPRPDNQVAFARIGLLAGRTGTALGPSGYVEINPIRWVGFCAIVSRSNATSDPDGGRARDWDFSTGACVTAHAPQIKGFLISPFLQMEYLNNHERFAMAEADGIIYRDSDDRLRRQWTVGTSVDRAIVRNGPRWAIRLGKNFGRGPASSEAGGLYFVGGLIIPLDHPKMLGRSLGMFRNSNPRDLSASAGHP